MKRMMTAACMLGLAMFGMTGCADTTTRTTETSVETPEGSTTITTEQEVEKTGDNPPVVNP